jgi:hypothetical protein
MHDVAAVAQVDFGPALQAFSKQVQLWPTTACERANALITFIKEYSSTLNGRHICIYCFPLLTGACYSVFMWSLLLAGICNPAN